MLSSCPRLLRSTSSSATDRRCGCARPAPGTPTRWRRCSRTSPRRARCDGFTVGPTRPRGSFGRRSTRTGTNGARSSAPTRRTASSRSSPSRPSSGCAIPMRPRSRSSSRTSSRAAESGRACSSSSPHSPRRRASSASWPTYSPGTRRCCTSSPRPASRRHSIATATRSGSSCGWRRRPRYFERRDERDHVAVAESLTAVLRPVERRGRRRVAEAGLDRRIACSQPPGIGLPRRALPDQSRRASRWRAWTDTRRVADIPVPADLAFVCVPGAAVLDVVESALRHGTRAICVISAGFAEVGPEGSARQDELLALVRAHGARLLGPNCVGIAVADPPLNGTFAAAQFPPGSIAFCSQSGALGLALLDQAKPARARILRVRLGGEQGGCLVERSPRVLGGRRAYGRRDPVSRVVRESAEVQPDRPPRRSSQADPRAQGRRRPAPGDARPRPTRRRSPAPTLPSRRSSIRPV